MENFNKNIQDSSASEINNQHADIGKLFHDHKNKCRFCFARFEDDFEPKQIEDSHQDIFQSLTNVEIKVNRDTSELLCSKCYTKLNELAEYREKKMKLHEKFNEFLQNPAMEEEIDKIVDATDNTEKQEMLQPKDECISDY